MKCKSCSVELNDGAKFCFSCGEKVELELTCSQCGETLVKGARFCSSCGGNVAEQQKDKPNISLIDSFDEMSDEEKSLKWYSNYFEYIGDFVDGFAPVIDNLSNPQGLGYVTLEIPKKLLTADNKNVNGQLILYYFQINKQIKDQLEDRINWVGEFRNGKALIASQRTIYTIDTQGNIEESGVMNYGMEFEFGKSIIAINKRLYGEKPEREHDCIIDFKGNIVRNNYEFINPLGFEDFATFINPGVSTSTKGLLKISNGKQLLEAKYESFDCEYEKLPDGTFKSVIISTIRNSKGEFQGCLNPYKGWVFKTSYPSIEIIRREDDYWNDGQLLVCLSQEEDEDKYETTYTMAVADITGKILFEYVSENKECNVIEGKTCLYIKNSKGVDVVRIDSSTLLSCPGAQNVRYIGDGYFKVYNQAGQCGVIDLNGKYTIPFGLFDKIDSRRITNGALKVTKDNLVGFADIHGTVLIPLMYESIRDEYSLSERPEILVYPIKGSWFYINYKNETDNGVPAEKHIADRE